jgi:hypothetical protein
MLRNWLQGKSLEPSKETVTTAETWYETYQYQVSRHELKLETVSNGVIANAKLYRKFDPHIDQFYPGYHDGGNVPFKDVKFIALDEESAVARATEYFARFPLGTKVTHAATQT